MSCRPFGAAACRPKGSISKTRSPSNGGRFKRVGDKMQFKVGEDRGFGLHGIARADSDQSEEFRNTSGAEFPRMPFMM
jgi:hypothetical protein